MAGEVLGPRPFRLLRRARLVGALVEGVGLDLVDRRRDLVVVDQVHQPVGVDVRDTDGPGAAPGGQALHGPPGAVDVAVGLVDQVRVEVVEAELARRGVEGAPGPVLAGVGDPQLGGDEQLLARYAAAPDRAAGGLLVTGVSASAAAHPRAGSLPPNADLQAGRPPRRRRAAAGRAAAVTAGLRLAPRDGNSRCGSGRSGSRKASTATGTGWVFERPRMVNDDPTVTHGGSSGGGTRVQDGARQHDLSPQRQQRRR